MSLKQISTYLNRLAMDDPNSDLFVRIVVPALKGSKSSDENSQIWFCPFCISNASGKHSFTSYYSFTRHLSSLHKSLLPMNGTIFSSSSTSSLFRCEICKRNFSRNEHLQQHFKSRIHLNHESTSNNTKPIIKLDLSCTGLSNHTDSVKSTTISKKDEDENEDEDDEDGLLKDWINQSEIFTSTKKTRFESSNNDRNLESNSILLPSSSTSSILLLSSSPNKKDRACESFSNTDDDDSMILSSWISNNIDDFECLQSINSKKREFIKTFRPHKSILKKYKNNIKKRVSFQASQTSSS